MELLRIINLLLLSSLSLQKSESMWRCNNCQLPSYVKNIYNYCSDYEHKEREYFVPDIITPYFPDETDGQNRILIINGETTILTRKMRGDIEPAPAVLLQKLKNIITYRTKRAPNSAFARTNTTNSHVREIHFVTDDQHYVIDKNFTLKSISLQDLKNCVYNPESCAFETTGLMEQTLILNKTLVNFYGEKSPLNDNLSRDYKIQVWTYEENLKEPKIISTMTLEGFLASAEIYEVTQTKLKGFYVTTDGNLCHFEKPKNLSNREDFNFEEYTKSIPRKPCKATQILFGCPQPWCFDVTFDTSFTIIDGQKRIIYIKKDTFYWKIEDKGSLPFDVPKMANAIHIEDDEKIGYKNFCFMNQNRSPQMTDPCISRDTDASFAIHRKNQYVFMQENTRKRYLIVPFKGETAATEAVKAFSNPLRKSDAFWFNSESNKLYTFKQNRISVYNVKYNESMGFSFVRVKSRNLLEWLGIEERHIDTVIDAMDNGYLFVGYFYYQVSKTGKVAKPAKVLTIEHLFDVQQACYKNNWHEFKKLIDRQKATHREFKQILAKDEAKPTKTTAAIKTTAIIKNITTARSTAAIKTTKTVTAAMKTTTTARITTAIKTIETARTTAAIKNITTARSTAAINTTKTVTAAIKNTTTARTTAAMETTTPARSTTAIKTIETARTTAAIETTTNTRSTTAIKTIKIARTTAVIKNTTTTRSTTAIKTVETARTTAAIENTTTARITVPDKNTTTTRSTTAIKTIETARTTAAIENTTNTRSTTAIKTIETARTTAAIKNITTATTTAVIETTTTKRTTAAARITTNATASQINNYSESPNNMTTADDKYTTKPTIKDIENRTVTSVTYNTTTSSKWSTASIILSTIASKNTVKLRTSTSQKTRVSEIQTKSKFSSSKSKSSQWILFGVLVALGTMAGLLMVFATFTFCGKKGSRRKHKKRHKHGHHGKDGMHGRHGKHSERHKKDFGMKMKAVGETHTRTKVRSKLVDTKSSLKYGSPNSLPFVSVQTIESR